MTYSFFKAALVAVTISLPALAHENGDQRARIDDHAPIGVMADHAHKAGELMMSARVMTMAMTDPANSMMGPQHMNTHMGMLGVMYAPSDKITFSAMIGYADRKMDMLMMGTTSEMKADGLSDLKLGAIMPLYKSAHSRLLANIGLTVPVGDKNDLNAMGMRLPATMQAGTGSWALKPGMTYVYFADGWSLGTQAGATVWLDTNRFGEKPGDAVQLTSWASLTVNRGLSISARLAYDHSDAWQGLAPQQGGARDVLSAFAGANAYLGSHRFAVEVGLPLSQDRGSNALKRGMSLTVGWQKAF